MAYYRFGPDDIYHNRIKAHPKCDFFIYDGRVYYNSNLTSSGKLTNDNIVTHVSESGHVSLFELNVDRPKEQIIYPFVTKDGTLSAFKTVSITSLNETDYGTEFKGTYPLSASISRHYFDDSTSDTGETDDFGAVVYKRRLVALKHTFDKYSYLSEHYKYSGPKGNKADQVVNLISIPSIFYGSSIKKGSVSLKFEVTGTLAGHLMDENRNGELIQVGPQGSGGSGSVAGVVLYNEGFIALTGAWAIDNKHTETYEGGASAKSPKWVYFAAGAKDSLIPPGTIPSSSFSIAFSGTNYIPTLTMMAHAPKQMLNHSSNPTYVEYSAPKKPSSGPGFYREPAKLKIKNIVSSSHCDHTASFKKQTYISQIGLYDDEENLVAIAKLATPVRKRQEDDFTFKLKLDL